MYLRAYSFEFQCPSLSLCRFIRFFVHFTHHSVSQCCSVMFSEYMVNGWAIRRIVATDCLNGNSFSFVLFGVSYVFLFLFSSDSTLFWLLLWFLFINFFPSTIVGFLRSVIAITGSTWHFV